ncbi:hypothetical protein ACCS75_04030 [Rhizobium ruizarguesonis]
MSETIEVFLPRPAAEKLFDLRSTPGDLPLVLNIEARLASVTHSGGHFAMAPPAAVSVGGAPLLQVGELRADIAIIARRLDYLVDEGGETLDPETHVLFKALAAHRLTLEREEEAVILQAAADGIVIDRRPDADPRAVLGLVEIEQAEA